MLFLLNYKLSSKFFALSLLFKISFLENFYNECPTELLCRIVSAKILFYNKI